MSTTTATRPAPAIPKPPRRLHLLTEAEFRRYLRRCEKIPGFLWSDGYKLEKDRKNAVLAAKAKRITRPLWIVTPSEHGNGGWCGSTVHDVMSRRAVLRCNPVEAYENGYYNPIFGSHIRACSKPDPNAAVYLWDHEAGRWLDKGGKPLAT